MAPKEPKRDDRRVFEQIREASGATRLDRRLTPEEAAAQDTAHRDVFVRQRRRRFGNDSPNQKRA